MLYEDRRFVWVYVFGYVNTSSTVGLLTAVNGGPYVKGFRPQRREAFIGFLQYASICIGASLTTDYSRDFEP